MEEILIHMIIISPLMKWFLGSNRKWNKGKREYGIYLCFLLLFLLGIYELRKSEKNHYELLNINSWATKENIQQSFRKMLKKYHPDKNNEPDSLDRFTKIREAYETLGNKEKKYYYDRYGDFGEGHINDFFYTEILIISIFQYVVSFILGFLYTFGRDNKTYRIVICLYITLNFCLEIIFRFSEESNYFLSFLPILCHYTPFERINAIRIILPLVMNGIFLIDLDSIENNLESYFYDFCQYSLEKNSKIINSLEDTVMFYARLIEGKIDKGNNFIWRKEKDNIDINIHELEDEHIYEQNFDENDIFYSSLYKIIENDNVDTIDLKIPKKELCRRLDWSRSHVTEILEKKMKEKNIIESSTTKGLILSSVFYCIGLISHLLSK